jgi:hypothetical protein
MAGRLHGSVLRRQSSSRVVPDVQAAVPGCWPVLVRSGSPSPPRSRGVQRPLHIAAQQPPATAPPRPVAVAADQSGGAPLHPRQSLPRSCRQTPPACSNWCRTRLLSPHHHRRRRGAGVMMVGRSIHHHRQLWPLHSLLPWSACGASGPARPLMRHCHVVWHHAPWAPPGPSLATHPTPSPGRCSDPVSQKFHNGTSSRADSSAAACQMKKGLGLGASQ